LIWIIGGTTESRELVENIEGDTKFVITSATESEKEFINIPNLLTGRLDYYDMIKFVEEKNINLIIDLSHPYAEIVSSNAKKVALEKNIKYIRYVRKKSDIPSYVVYFKALEECLEYLKNISGTVFFTTGSKNIRDFEKVRGKNRYIYRVLPASLSIEECKKYNIHMKDIIALLGPFSKEFSKIMFKEYDANYVVMKDSGKEGGFIERLEACKDLDITPVVIGRQKEEGIHNLEEILRVINKWSQGKEI